MSWLARKTIDLIGAATQLYYSRKYRALAHQLGRPTNAQDTTRPGFIIIQIDGLSHAHLQAALAQGAMPHLRRTMENEKLRLIRWRCGLPSTTPAVQAGIMYGDNFDIPGFRWYEKESSASIVCKRPDQLHALAERLSSKRRGLLHGGSSYANLLDGDASLAIFTLSALGSTFFDNVRGIGFALLFLLSPWRVLRAVVRLIYEYTRDVVRRIGALFAPHIQCPIHWVSPLLRIVVDVVIAEIQTFGVLLDIYRGAPAIYATYSSYDDMAHHCGPDHPEATRTLRHIDTHLHQINRMRKQYRRYLYDLYILSDHGMSTSHPLEQRFDQTLGQFILSSIGEPLILDERSGEEKQLAIKTQHLQKELFVLEQRLSTQGASVIRRMRQALERRTPADPEFLGLDIERRGDIIVRPSGGLAHIYFNIATRRLNLSEIALLYPTLLNKLLEHPGIGLIIGCENIGHTNNACETLIIGNSGTRSHSTNQTSIEKDDPLASLPNPDIAASDLVRLASFPHSGDLILLGKWNSDNSVINFEKQAGSHGGLGGPQNEPFIIAPDDELAHLSPLDPIKLHFYLAQKYRGQLSSI